MGGTWPTGEEYDAQLLAEGDRRNVVDRYRYWTMEAIVADLDRRRHDFHVAIENWQHDFNIGTIVRTANAFLAREVHIVGPAPLEPSRRDGDRPLPAHATPRDRRPTWRRPRRAGRRALGIDNLPGLRAARDAGAAAPGLPALRAGGAGAVRGGAGAVRGDVLDRAVRLDAVDQRLGGGGDRDAHLGGAARSRATTIRVRRPRSVRRARRTRLRAARAARRTTPAGSRARQDLGVRLDGVPSTAQATGPDRLRSRDSARTSGTIACARLTCGARRVAVLTGVVVVDDRFHDRVRQLPVLGDQAADVGVVDAEHSGLRGQQPQVVGHGGLGEHVEHPRAEVLGQDDLAEVVEERGRRASAGTSTGPGGGSAGRSEPATDCFHSWPSARP